MARKLVEEASARLSDAFKKGNIISEAKAGGQSIVTQLDRDIESFLVERIHRVFPDDAIIAEEGGNKKGTSGFTWFIDPIDGTRNFAFGIPFFGISVAIAEQNILQYGIISAPAQDIFYWAEKGKGAFKNGKKIRVDEAAKVGKQITAIGFVAAHSPQVIKKTASLVEKIVRIRILGSAALNLCLVAEGHAAAFIGFDCRSWDIAAGMLIVEEAGGTVSNINGEPIDLFGSNAISIIASNGTEHDTLVKLVEEL